jgi:hypothetical protein
MPYTLKVDWTGYRTQAVIEALAAWPALTAQLRLYVNRDRMDEVSTIKLNWSTTVRGAVVNILEQWLASSDRRCLDTRGIRGDYEYLVQQQVQVHAALRDIHLYAVAAAEHETAGE